MADEEGYADDIEVVCVDGLRIIMLTGEIDERKSQQFVRHLMELSTDDPTQPITIYLSTYGGDTYEMNAMYDAMRMSPCPLYTIGIGKVMSAGVLLLSAGDKRAVTENTYIMMHQVSIEVYGTVTDLSTEVKYTKAMQDNMYKLYSKYTGKSIKQLEADLKSDKYMTAEEALEYGLIDEIITSQPDPSKVKKRKRK